MRNRLNQPHTRKIQYEVQSLFRSPESVCQHLVVFTECRRRTREYNTFLRDLNTLTGRCILYLTSVTDPKTCYGLLRIRFDLGLTHANWCVQGLNAFTDFRAADWTFQKAPYGGAVSCREIITSGQCEITSVKKSLFHTSDHRCCFTLNTTSPRTRKTSYQGGPLSLDNVVLTDRLLISSLGISEFTHKATHDRDWLSKGGYKKPHSKIFPTKPKQDQQRQRRAFPSLALEFVYMLD